MGTVGDSGENREFSPVSVLVGVDVKASGRRGGSCQIRCNYFSIQIIICDHSYTPVSYPLGRSKKKIPTI